MLLNLAQYSRVTKLGGFALLVGIFPVDRKAENAPTISLPLFFSQSWAIKAQ